MKKDEKPPLLWGGFSVQLRNMRLPLISQGMDIETMYNLSIKLNLSKICPNLKMGKRKRLKALMYLAGDAGVEPASAVLETAVLPLN